MAFPIGDVNPTHRTPLITLALILVNLAIYFLVQPVDECASAAFLWRNGGVPEELLSLQVIPPSELGPLLGECAALIGEKSVIASAFTSMFLHGSILHLGGNMLFLWVFGNNVEDHFGRLRFLAFYLLSGVIAVYGYAAAHPDAVTTVFGASGAVAGVLGAYLLTYPRARVHSILPFPLWLGGFVIPGWQVRGIFFVAAVVTIPAWVALGAWFILEGLSAPDTASGVAVEAHVVGFAAGVFLALFLDEERRRELVF